MKQSIQISILIIFTLLVVVPPAAFSEVQISLKNGRDIIADSCRDTKDKLVCEKMGGAFEIDKKDVLETKGITIERSNLSGSRTQPAAESTDRRQDGPKPDPDVKGATKASEGAVVKGLTPEAEKRLAQTTRRKMELQKERESLVRDRDQLREDVKNSGMIRTQEKLDSTNKRISDLDARINSFNKEANDLNAEEKKILEGPAPR